jgi:hypothetical protein
MTTGLGNFLSDRSCVQKLTDVIEKNIKSFHNLLCQPITGTIWEELLSRSFSEIGYETTWKPNNSHKVGEDMKIISLDDSRISCKSGVIINNRTHKLGECVHFSSSRTSSFKTLDEKLKHLSKSHCDYHFMLSKKDKMYKLLIIKADVCNVMNLDWESNKNGNPDDYVSKVGGPFKATITGSMSGQLWVTLPLTLVEYIFDIGSS